MIITNFQIWVYRGMGFFFCLQLKSSSKIAPKHTTNALLNLLNQQVDIGKIYLYATDLSESKYEFLIKKNENVRIALK